MAENRFNHRTIEQSFGTTSESIEYLRKFPLDILQTVIVKPDGNGYVSVSFLFDITPNNGYTVTISNGFCVGYKGEGPWGLHDLMIEAGFAPEEAEKVFSISRYDETVLHK